MGHPDFEDEDSGSRSAIDPVDIPLLRRHGELPDADSILDRFAVVFQDTLSRLRADAQASEAHRAEAARAEPADEEALASEPDDDAAPVEDEHHLSGEDVPDPLESADPPHAEDD